jgi:hypothetical protein
MHQSNPGAFDPVSADNKHVADDIEAEIGFPVSIEEEMMLEAAELEESEFRGKQAPGTE